MFNDLSENPVTAERRSCRAVAALVRSLVLASIARSQGAVPYSAEALCSVLTRHVSWLSVSAGHYVPWSLTAAFPVHISHQWHKWRVLLTDYSGATATDSHRFSVGCTDQSHTVCVCRGLAALTD